MIQTKYLLLLLALSISARVVMELDVEYQKYIAERSSQFDSQHVVVLEDNKPVYHSENRFKIPIPINDYEDDMSLEANNLSNQAMSFLREKKFLKAKIVADKLAKVSTNGKAWYIYAVYYVNGSNDYFNGYRYAYAADIFGYKEKGQPIIEQIADKLTKGELNKAKHKGLETVAAIVAHQAIYAIQRAEFVDALVSVHESLDIMMNGKALFPVSTYYVKIENDMFKAYKYAYASHTLGFAPAKRLTERLEKELSDDEIERARIEALEFIKTDEREF
jgi:hypothetical protein